MDLNCDDVRNLLGPSGASTPLSEERAEQVADHLDRCPTCDARLGREIAGALTFLPVTAPPSLPAVRELAQRELRRSTVLRLSGLAAAALLLVGTGWALLQRDPSAASVADRRTPTPAPAPIPDPPKIADLSEFERGVIRSEGVVVQYLQFCLTCINDPTEKDKQEYLTHSLLIFREVRGRLRSAFERRPTPTVDAVTFESLSDALALVRTSKLPSVTFLATKINGFRFLPTGQWQVDHQLGGKNWRLTLDPTPDYLNFAYLRIALGAGDAQMARIEDALWATFVKLPARIEDKDPTLAPRSLETVLPLLSPRQQAIYRKIVGTP